MQSGARLFYNSFSLDIRPARFQALQYEVNFSRMRRRKQQWHKSAMPDWTSDGEWSLPISGKSRRSLSARHDSMRSRRYLHGNFSIQDHQNGGE